MHTCVHLWWSRAKFFAEWEVFQTKVVKKIKTYILCSVAFFLSKVVPFMRTYKVYDWAREAALDNTTRRMHIACWIAKATDTHSEYVILIVFLRQQWLRESVLKLRYMYIAGIVECDYHPSHMSVWYTWRFKVICVPSTRILFHCTNNGVSFCFRWVRDE